MYLLVLTFKVLLESKLCITSLASSVRASYWLILFVESHRSNHTHLQKIRNKFAHTAIDASQLNETPTGNETISESVPKRRRVSEEDGTPFRTEEERMPKLIYVTEQRLTIYAKSLCDYRSDKLVMRNTSGTRDIELFAPPLLLFGLSKIVLFLRFETYYSYYLLLIRAGEAR